MALLYWKQKTMEINPYLHEEEEPRIVSRPGSWEDGIDIFQEKGNWEWGMVGGNKMRNFVLNIQNLRNSWHADGRG